MITEFAKKYLLPVTIFLFLISIISCSSVSKEALIADINIYKSYIDEIHADPYRLITRDQFQSKAEMIKQAVLRLDSEKISQKESFFYLQELAASIKDGHTRIRFPHNMFDSTDQVFPLVLKAIDGKFYVVENLSSNSIPKYCTLISINEIPIETIYAKSNHLYNTSLDHAKYGMFEDYFNLILVEYLKINPPWKVKFEVNSIALTARLDAITASQAIKKKKRFYNQYKYYSTYVGLEEIPILYLPNFHYGKEDGFKRFIDSFFHKYNNSRYLIIDLRNNRGGSGYRGFYVLDYLGDSPYQIAKKFEFKVSKKMRGSIYAEKAGSQLRYAKNGEYFDVVKHKIWIPHQTSAKFRGKVFLMVSEDTFSAAVVFSAVFKANRMGLVIGRETAGRVRFCSDSVVVKLPDSRLKTDIPLAIYELPGENPDRGVMPDIVVSRTIEDYRSGRDVEIEKIKELIQNDMVRQNS
jgi:hypothetical protein